MERKAFLVDENLSGLARYLRFMGYDTEVAQGLRDDEVIARGAREGRILITRDSDLLSLSEGPLIWLRSDDLRDQLTAVLAETGGAEPDTWFSRCSGCNLELRPLSDPAADPRVPESVKGREPCSCWECESCGRVYWKGSHYDRTLRFLESLL